LNEAIRGFSTSGLYREEEKKEEKKVEKKNSIWGNIVDFVKTIQEGRRLKKVEEEMKQQYTKLVANALLEVGFILKLSHQCVIRPSEIKSK